MTNKKFADMKMLHAKYLFLFAGLLLFGACSEDFLEVEPRGTELEDNYYRNAEEALTGLIAVYDNVGGVSGPYLTKFIGANAASDDCYAGGGNASDIVDLQVWNNYTLTPAQGPQDALWSKGFSGIFRANVILAKLPEVPMDEDLRKRYIAEGRFLRAYFYFDLVRLFENIPLFEKPISTDEMYDVLQADPSEVYNLIEADLSAAITDLPPTVPVATEGGRATQGAAHALLGKVYLWQERFDLAADHFAQVNGAPGGTSQYGYELLDDFADLWQFDNKHNPETVFGINHTGDANWGDWGCIACAEGNWLNIMVNPRGYTRLDPSAPDYNSGWSFNPVTPELEAFMRGDPRYASTIANVQALEDDGLVTYEKGYDNTGFFLEKFTSLQADRNEGGVIEGNFDQMIYDIRLADTYLMEAEAIVRGGGDMNRAQALLDAVRARVGLPSVPATFDNIKAERRLELAGEGVRWFDLVRWGDAPTVLADQGFEEGKHEILPIPLLELENTQLEQNMEYGGPK